MRQWLMLFLFNIWVYNGNEVEAQYTIDPTGNDTLSKAIYEYTNGKLTKSIQMEAGKKTITEYSWTDENIAQMKTFEVTSGGCQLTMTMQTDILYDAMTNPMKAMNLPSNNAEAHSANNPTAMTLTDDSGSNAGTASITYTYDGNLPISYDMSLFSNGNANEFNSFLRIHWYYHSINSGKISLKRLFKRAAFFGSICLYRSQIKIIFAAIKQQVLIHFFTQIRPLRIWRMPFWFWISVLSIHNWLPEEYASWMCIARFILSTIHPKI